MQRSPDLSRILVNTKNSRRQAATKRPYFLTQSRITTVKVCFTWLITAVFPRYFRLTPGDHFPSPREQTVAGLLLAELGYVSLAASCLTDVKVEKDLVIGYLSAQSPRDVLKRVVLNWLPPALLNLLRGRRSAG
jgi:hypothetical protein